MSGQWKRIGLALAVTVCLALVAGATAIATSPSDSNGERLDSKSAAMAAWPDEKKSAWNVGVDEKVAYLAEKGITAETTEIAPGVRGIVSTSELKAALKNLKGEDKDMDGKSDPKLKSASVAAWPDEKKAAWNAGLDEKVVWLEEQGITVETTEIAPGVRDIVWTDEVKSALKDLGDGKK